MKKTFRARITLADSAVHVRHVSASSAVDLFDRLTSINKEFPTHVRSECLALRRCPQCRYYPFAPGAIEYLPRRRRWSRVTRISVTRAALVVLVMGSMAAIGSLLTGGLL